MDVKAVNSVSLQQSFEGKSKRKENKNNAEYPQMDSPASKKASKAMRDMAMGLMLLGAAAGTTSCVDADAQAEAEANAWAWGWVINNGGCNCKPDTIFQTTPIKEVNWAVNDSIKNQFINIGAEVDGPVDGDNVLLVSGKFRNRYDNKTTEFQVDSAGCNNDQMMYVSKITNLYNPKQPKIQWVKTIAEDMPGEGIRYTFTPTYSYVTEKPTHKTQYNPDRSFSVIVSNGARGNRPGVNTIRIMKPEYDENDNIISEKLIWKGELNKGQQKGTFFYSTFTLDKDGLPYIDPETGKPEVDNMDYDNCKICTREVDWGKFQQPTKIEDYDLDLWH